MDRTTILQRYHTKVVTDLLYEEPVTNSPVALVLDVHWSLNRRLAPLSFQVRSLPSHLLIEVPGRLHGVTVGRTNSNSRASVLPPLRHPQPRLREQITQMPPDDVYSPSRASSRKRSRAGLTFEGSAPFRLPMKIFW